MKIILLDFYEFGGKTCDVQVWFKGGDAHIHESCYEQTQVGEYRGNLLGVKFCTYSEY